MRIQFVSDIHLEASPCAVPVAGDVIVLAGDIHNGLAGLEWARKTFGDRPVIYVAGNHEYYGTVFPDFMTVLKATAEGSAVHVLENDGFETGGVRFLGATLWTDYRLLGLDHQDRSMAVARKGMTDFKQISPARGRKVLPEHFAEAHQASKAWLHERLAEPFSGPTVVVTHHPPCGQSIHPRDHGDPLGPALASNLESMIMTFQPALWISGHTHYCCDYTLNRTRLVSNARGYFDSDDTGGFKPDRVVEI